MTHWFPSLSLFSSHTEVEVKSVSPTSSNSPFELIDSDGACVSGNSTASSVSSLWSKRSFRDICFHTTDHQTHKLNDSYNKKLPPLPITPPSVCFGEVNRCPSTATTPTSSIGSDEDSARSVSPFELDYNEFSEDGEQEDSSCEDVCDEDDEQDEYDAYFSPPSFTDAYDSHISTTNQSSSCMRFTSGAYARSFRVRHKNLGGMYISAYGRFAQKMNEQRIKAQRIHYLKTYHSKLRLQIASAPVCRAYKGYRNKPQGVIPKKQVVNPYDDESETQEPEVKKQKMRTPPAPTRTRSKRSNDIITSDNAPAFSSTLQHAMSHTMPASHRRVLQSRANRKLELAHERAARELVVPKHLRPNSKKCVKQANNKKARQLQAWYNAEPTEPDVDNAYPVTRCRTFSHFRYNFFRHNQKLIENALGGWNRYRVSEVRIAPINGNTRGIFMQHLKSQRANLKNEDVALTYHGTALENMQSILNRGLLIPDKANGVAVKNGSSFGVGIYSSRCANYSVCYTGNTTCTIFVCATLTRGPPSAVYNGGDIVVSFEESRIIPLFLLDYEMNPQAQPNHTMCEVVPSRPHHRWLDGLDLARSMLRKVWKMQWNARHDAKEWQNKVNTQQQQQDEQ